MKEAIVVVALEAADHAPLLRVVDHLPKKICIIKFTLLCLKEYFSSLL